MTPRYFDIHSHLFFKDFEQDLQEVLSRMKQEGVDTLTVGTELKTSKESVAFCEEKEGFYATIGLHPNHSGEEKFEKKEYEKLVKNPKVVAIGECGIDYFRIEGDIASGKKKQVALFEQHIEFALEHDLPLMIHARPSKGTMDAYTEVANVIESRQKTVGEKLRGNMHFFVGDVAVARRFYELGFTTSFTGVLTFTKDYDEVVKFAPLDMIMTETDAPFVAPAPYRGRRNEPTHVKYIVEAIARIRNDTTERIRSVVVENAQRAFSFF